MITSGQVNQMHMASMQMHAMAPPPGMMGQPNMGMSQYPPQFSYGIQGYQNPNASIANRATSGMIGAAQGALGAAGAVNMVAGLGVMGAGMLGMGAAVPAGIAAVGSLPVTAGLMAAGVGVSSIAAGHRQMGQVNQIFGNQQFANPNNPMGRGFSRGDLNQLYGMVRSIDKNDPFTSMQDALRITDQLAMGSEFGLAQGVKSAEELSSRVSKMAEAMKKMAKTMGTTLDEAFSVGAMSRQAGFYTAADVMGNTQTFMMGRNLGFTSQQVGQQQIAGAGVARAAGLTGQAGARFATNMTQDLALMMRMGNLNENALMDLTGTTNRNEAATAFAQDALGMMANLGQTGHGSAMLAGLMTRDSSGNVSLNQGLLESMRGGNVGFNQLIKKGGQNLRTNQGREDFVKNKDLLLSELMASDDALTALMETVNTTAKAKGEDAQLIAQTMLGLNAKQFRMMKDATDNLKAVRQERISTSMLELQTQQQQLNIRQNATFGGISQRISGGVSDFVQETFVDRGARFSGNMGIAAEDAQLAALGLVGMGRTSYRLDNSKFSEIARVAAASASGDDLTDDDKAMLSAIRGGSVEMTLNDRLSFGAASGNRSAVSSILTEEMGRIRAGDKRRGSSTVGRVKEGTKRQIREKMKQIHREDDPDRRAELLQEARELIADDLPDIQGEIVRTGLHGDIKAEHLGSVDAIIADISGEDGTAAISKVRATHGTFSEDNTFEAIEEAKSELAASLDIDDRSVLRKAAEYGGIGLLFGGVGGAMAGIATAIYQGEDQLKGLTEGEGTALVAKAKTPAKMKRIDDVISQAMRDHPTTEKAMEAAAKKLSSELGIKVTASDVRNYDEAMKRATGAGDAKDRSTHDVGHYEKEYGAAFKLSKSAKNIEDKLAAKLGAESLKSLTSQLGSDLEDLGLESAGMDSLAAGGTIQAESAFVALGDVLTEMSTKNVTADQVQGKGALMQFLQMRSEDLRTVTEGMEDGKTMSLEDFAALVGEDSGAFRAAQDLVDQGEFLDKENVEKLLTRQFTEEALGLGIEGAAALTTATEAGMTPMEQQAKAMKQAAEMIDALYAHATKSAPSMPDNAVAAGMKDFDADTGSFAKPE